MNRRLRLEIESHCGLHMGLVAGSDDNAGELSVARWALSASRMYSPGSRAAKW